MSDRLNVERTKFDLDTFQKILEAMDGYHVLPWRLEEGAINEKPRLVAPWELPGMPDVSVDVWRYHVGFAIDRGFVECWKPDPYEPRPWIYYESNQFEADLELAEDEMRFRPPNRGTDANVSSRLLPARLTYAGKEFVDNLRNPSVKRQALEFVQRYGLPAVFELVKRAPDMLMPVDTASVAHPER